MLELVGPSVHIEVRPEISKYPRDARPPTATNIHIENKRVSLILLTSNYKDIKFIFIGIFCFKEVTISSQHTQSKYVPTIGGTKYIVHP